jgi:hypothetical protein
MQPGGHRKREPGDDQQVADGRLRFGRGAGKKLRQGRCLGDHRGGGLQGSDEKPHADPQDQPGNRFSAQGREARAGPVEGLRSARSGADHQRQATTRPA